MQPTLGQGGGMAIEDALVLGQELRRDVLMRGGPAVPLALGRYQQNRVRRAAAVQGISRSASAFLFQYNHPTTIDLLAEGGPTARAEHACVCVSHLPSVPTCRYAQRERARALHVHLARISHASQVSNIGPRSLIVRTLQGLLQSVAFSLVYEFLFSFPGSLQPHARWLTPHPHRPGPHTCIHGLEFKPSCMRLTCCPAPTGP